MIHINTIDEMKSTLSSYELLIAEYTTQLEQLANDTNSHFNERVAFNTALNLLKDLHETHRLS